MQRDYILGIIGYGHMGSAIAKGLLKSGILKNTDIAVFAYNEKTVNECKKEGFNTIENESILANSCKFLLIAVSPKKVSYVIDKIKGSNINTLISIAAGVPTKTYTDVLGNISVIRAMPNTPLQIQEGATALSKNEYCSNEDYEYVFKLFNALGKTQLIDEKYMSETVAINGSTPAYFYYVIDCMIKDIVNRGIDEKVARDLIVQTMLGSAKLLQNNEDKAISSFLGEVCTKGGTTIEAITTLKENNLEKIIHEANESCILKAKELGKNH